MWLGVCGGVWERGFTRGFERRWCDLGKWSGGYRSGLGKAALFSPSFLLVALVLPTKARCFGEWQVPLPDLKNSIHHFVSRSGTRHHPCYCS